MSSPTYPRALPTPSRRDFLKLSTGLTATLAGLGRSPRVFAAGSDHIRVGLIGCGGRGTGAGRGVGKPIAEVRAKVGVQNLCGW
jgi:hypothetical protein